MAITGSIPFTKMQGVIEATRGTAATPTRVLPVISGTLNQHEEEVEITEQRYSLIGSYYAPIRVKRWVEIDVEVIPSIEDLIYWNQFGILGNSSIGSNLAASTVNSTVKRYTHTSTSSQGVNQSMTLEVGDDTQAYVCNMMVVDRVELGWSLGGMLTAKYHLMGSKAVTTSFTGALSAQGTEVLNGSVAKAYIDSSSIGTTIVTAPTDMTFTLENNISLFWAPNGDIVPTDFYHNAPRRARMESTIRHTADTENAAFIAQTLRKIRTTILGSEVAASSPSTNVSLTIDWYGYWSEAPFQDADGLNAQRMVGNSVYNSSATHDWKVVEDSAVSSIV